MSNDNDNKEMFDNQSNDRIIETPTGLPLPPPAEPPPRQKGIRAWHIVLSVLGGLLALNLVFGLFIGGGGAVTDSHVTDRGFPAAGISHLSTDLSTARIEVRTHGGSDIRVRFEPPSTGRYHRPRYELRNGRLHIYSNEGFRGIQILGFNTVRSGTLHIYLPNTASPFNVFDLRTTTGRIVVNAHPQNVLADRVQLNSTTGRVVASNISANEINIVVTTGRIVLDNITSNSLNARSTTGRIELSNAEGDIRLDATTGRINLTDIRARNLNATTSTGRIEAARISVSGDANLTSTTGRVTATTGEIAGDTRIRTTTGRIELTNVQAHGRLDTNTTTGRVRVN